MEWLGNNWLEMLAAAFGIWSVWLSTREHLWAWPTAIVNVLLYVVVFRAAKLYADMGLQVFYAVISAYGWYHWKHGGANDTVLHVSRTSRQEWVVLGAVAIVGAAGLGRLLASTTDAALPTLDASLSVGSLVAQYMMTRKLLENWVVWIALDLVYIGMFEFKQLHVTSALYVVWLVLGVIGWRSWRESLRAQGA